MQEVIQKRKEKTKPYEHKRTKKPIFKPKDKTTESKTHGTPKIPVIAEQKGKSRFIAPKTGNPQKIEIKTAALPIFRSKKSTVKSVRTEQEIKSISIEISVKREAKERLKCSIEELLSDPQQLTNLSSVLKEFEEKIAVKTDFDSSIPSKRSPVVKEKFKVPEIKSENFTPPVSKTGFDTSLPEITIKPVIPIMLPEISITKQPEVMTRTNFDEEVSSQVVSKIIGFQELGNEEEEIEEAVETIVEGEIVTSEISEDEAGGKESEPLDFLKIALGKGAGIISEDKPICVIVEKTKENYEELIAVLCRDIFREKHGGKPEPIYKNNIEELKQEFESLVQGKIIVVKNVEKSSKGLKHLNQILKGFFSQDIGFLILVSPEPLKLDEKIRSEEQSANIITVHPRPELGMRRDEIMKIVRGKRSSIQAESFGEEFKKSSESIESDLIKKYLTSEKAPEQLRYDWDKLVASSPDGDEDASPLHSAMKAFVWWYEWKKYGKKIIPVLEPTESRKEDVRMEADGESKSYEVETLFGRKDVLGHLTRKIKKYEENEEVYFVLKNLDILRNLSIFLRFKKDWKERGYKVEFFGLDLDKKELVPLKEFESFIKSIKSLSL